MRASLLFKEKISNITRNAFIFGFTHCPPAEQNVVIFVLELILCVTIQQILIGLETEFHEELYFLNSCKSRTVLWT